MLIDIHVHANVTEFGQDRPFLVTALVARGFDVTLSRGAGAYDPKTGVVAALAPRVQRVADRDVITVRPRSVDLATVSAIRNETRALDVGVPELSDPRAKALTEDKLAANRLLATLGLAKAFAPLDTALHELDAWDVVVKLRDGKRSTGLWMGTKAQLAVLYHTGKINRSREWIVEERLDTTLPLPLAGASQRAAERLAVANANRVPKELRVWVFGRDAGGRLLTSAAIREGQVGSHYLHDDEWIFIAEDAAPVEVLRDTDRIVVAIEVATGVHEIHIAVDWAFARVGGDAEPRWLPMELNSDPELVWEEDSPALARDHAAKLADQLARVAQAGAITTTPRAPPGAE